MPKIATPVIAIALCGAVAACYRTEPVLSEPVVETSTSHYSIAASNMDTAEGAEQILAQLEAEIRQACDAGLGQRAKEDCIEDLLATTAEEIGSAHLSAAYARRKSAR